MLQCWRNLLDVSNAELALLLDKYLDHKNRFFARVREPAFTAAPGLHYFADRYFRALQSNQARSRWRSNAIRYGSSKRLEMTPFGDACQYLLESRNLRRVELRIAPFDRAPDYWRFFKKWSLLKHQIDADQISRQKATADIRFAIHFKRSRGRFGRRSRSHTRTRLAELDKQSSALCAALACPTRGPLLSAISRVDIAGQERDTSLATFAWHFRLIREDPDTLLAFENGTIPPPWADHMAGWRGLEARGLHKFVANVRRLGATVHAGEDFADALDGLYQVASAVDLCGLGAGDGIGHALALVAGQRKYSKRYGEVAMPLGEALDQLCWLRQTIHHFTPRAELFVQQQRLDAAISSSAERLYAGVGDLPRRATVADFLWLWNVKSGRNPAWKRDSATDQIKRELLTLEADEAFWLRRDRFDMIRSRDEHATVVEAGRKWLLKRVCDSGIVVEMNPSSNLRISGSESSAENPAVLLAKAMATGLQACINTDNPGVFVSCIENEFALLLDGLKGDESLDAREIRDLLEMARKVGMEFLK